MSSVIGIHDGHNAAAALVKNGCVELILQEERFTRIKNQGDAPASAVRAAMDLAGENTTRVALNGLYMNYGQWHRETIANEYQRSSSLASRCKQPLKNTVIDHVYQRQKAGARKRELAKLGVDIHLMEPVEHHLAHASAAYYTCPWRASGGETLVLTCDGSGDRLCATVSIGEGLGLQRIAEIS